MTEYMWSFTNEQSNEPNSDIQKEDMLSTLFFLDPHFPVWVFLSGIFPFNLLRGPREGRASPAAREMKFTFIHHFSATSQHPSSWKQ